MSVGSNDKSGRYTVVLTGRYGNERSYLTVDEDGNVHQENGRPPVERLRGEIKYRDLPDAAKEEVLRVYRDLWNL